MWNQTSLAGKRVLVTAGADGIGLEITRAFAAAGAKVLVCDIQPESLDRLAKELPDVYGCIADVSREEAVASLFDVVDQKLGGLDVLVNNAGVAGPTGGIETLSLADWERTLAVNLTGQFLCIRQAVPRLRKGSDPSIVNLASAAGHLGMPGRSPYSASKWAVVGLTKTLAIELGGDGIRVNAILPGAVDGPRIRAVIAAKAEALGKPLEEVTRAYTAQAALGRMVTTRDIANMVLFAASDLAGNVTGQELVVDGHTQALS
ncbi:SDR family oxidoreductase [Paraburkholderia kirstenboschensis]|uniref:SDR family oxidoreductase n=1 Tax=Paraburkholderia kirstenboschensis TaxID=1245436 RepID=A0ABZ0ECX3_9BURK|nr:SDR family oxidoreductase [Paraburkholderia kirstenboschensis]WOD14369.1 SDR family oxidoreductase [Paraburkholderia kirstenboschensis]